MNSEFSKGTSCLPDLGSNTMLIIEVTFTYISKEVFAHIHKVVAYIWKVLACMACIFFDRKLLENRARVLSNT